MLGLRTSHLRLHGFNLNVLVPRLGDLELTVKHGLLSGVAALQRVSPA